MSLKLITGPANSGKAERVLAETRREAARGGEPWLVVPTVADEREYRRELARDGLVLGARVVRFPALLGEAARRAGLSGPQLEGPLRTRLMGVLAREVGDGATGGLREGRARELERLVAELEALHLTPQAVSASMAEWAGDGDEGAAEAAALVASVYGRYRDLLAAIGWCDAELQAAGALDELRRNPWRWGATPVQFYGFDDLTAVQRDAIETLAVVVGAPVTVALSYEPGRMAFAARGGTYEALRPWATELVALDPASEHYSAAARDSLSHIERGIFESGRSSTLAPRAAEDTVTLLEGASEREEMELVGAAIGDLIASGMRPSEIAVVHRNPAAMADAIADVLGEHSIGARQERTARFADTALGCGLLALLRCAVMDGDAEELVRWLRTPGVVRRSELVDRFERDLRLASVVALDDARAIWEAEHWALSALERLREAEAAGTDAFIERVQRELWLLFERPRAALGRTLVSGEEAEAVALREGAAALGALRELVRGLEPPDARVAAMMGSASEVVALLEALRLHARAPVTLEEAVAVLDPLSLRARRVRALFLCGLQEGVFPLPARAAAYFDGEERRALAERTGLVLRHDEDALGGERFLFYACLSRPQERLVLSWHAADDDGRVTPRSLFVDDLCDLFEGGLAVRGRPERSGARSAAGPWPRGIAPLGAGGAGEPNGEERAATLGAAATPGAQRETSERRMWSASSLETWVSCPVRWYVENVLRPARMDPDAESQVTGRVMHEVLRSVLEALREQTGSARVTEQRLGGARALMREALDRECAEVTLARTPERGAGVRRWLEATLDRYLAAEADRQSEFEPTHFEVDFGRPGADGSGFGVLDLGEGVRVRGRIDRVDVAAGGAAIVYDYKRTLRDGMEGRKWASTGTVQVAIYMRAVRDLLGYEVVGGLYQPLTGEKLAARGAVREDAEQAPVRTDRLGPDEFAERVEAAIEVARQAAREASSGQLEARPATCSRRGEGCSYPAICRAGRGGC